MPSLKDASIPPANLKKMVPVSAPAANTQQPPSATSIPDFDPLSLAPAPPLLATAPDSQRQWFRRGVSQYRISPLPSKANPSINASARSIAQEVVNNITQVTAGGLNTALNTATITTNSLANLASQTGSVNMAKGFLLFFVQFDHAARIRLYSTAAGRDTSPEPTRPVSVAVTPGLSNQIICDIVLTGLPGVPLTFPCSNIIPGGNQDTGQSSSIYWAIQNISGSTTTITATLSFLQLEA